MSRIERICPREHIPVLREIMQEEAGAGVITHAIIRRPEAVEAKRGSCLPEPDGNKQEESKPGQKA